MMCSSQFNAGEKPQKAFLGGFERYVGVTHPELTATVPKVLMALYQADVLDEELLNHWGTHASKKYVDKDVSKKIRSAASPFLKVSFNCDMSLVGPFTDRFLNSGWRKQRTMKNLTMNKSIQHCKA